MNAHSLFHVAHRLTLGALLLFSSVVATAAALDRQAADPGSRSFHANHWQNTYQPLMTFENDKGHKRLDVSITAEKRTVSIGGYTVKSNVYRICKLKSPGGSVKHCNSGHEYAGGRLLTSQGQTLGIQLNNRLADTVSVDDEPVKNLTNLHTHGLVVRAYGSDKDPRFSDDRLPGDPTGGVFGDLVFPVTQPAADTPDTARQFISSHGMSQGPSAHSDMLRSAHPIIGDNMRFDIRIPGNSAHPQDPAGHASGSYWFHPHAHTLAKMQVSGGMSGMINVGKLSDYACRKIGQNPAVCEVPYKEGTLPLRHMLLKDAQLININEDARTATMLYDQDPGFCEDTAALANATGFCTGDAPDANGDSRPGRWVFSINGVMHPQWQVPPGGSEIWRIQNASANITYDLSLSGSGWPDPTDAASADAQGMPFQVLSVDGASLGGNGASRSTGNQLLQNRVLLMPGSRVEMLVTWRDPSNCKAATDVLCPVVVPTRNSTIRLKTARYDTGGDAWPRIELAAVRFAGRRKAGKAGMGSLAMLTRPLPSMVRELSTQQAGALHSGRSASLCESGMYYRLHAGEKRRIYFGIANDQKGTEDFILGHTIVKSDGTEILEDGSVAAEGPVMRIFDVHSDKAQLCVPPSAGEVWELVNISPEVHNFHIHQNRFLVKIPQDGCTGPACPRFSAPSRIDQRNIDVSLVYASGVEPVTHDTMIVPRGGDCLDSVEGGEDGNGNPVWQWQFRQVSDGTYRIDQYGAEHCRGSGYPHDSAGAITLSIPFDRPEQLGKYVFHCHILEHEDKGMMASIRVLTNDQMAGAQLAGF